MYCLMVLGVRSPKWVWVGSSQVVVRAMLLFEATEEAPFPCLFQLLKVIHIPWPMAPSPSSKAAVERP